MAPLGLLPLLALLTASTPAPTPAPANPLPFTPREVIEKVQYSFRPEGDGFSGGHRTYRVHHDDGRLTVTPLAYRVAPADAHRGSLTLGAPILQRGPRAMRLAAPQSAVSPDGTLRVQRGVVEEHFQNSAAGVEQSWHFSAPPPGSGPLTVRIPVRGLAYQAATSTGLHFTDERLGASLRYGLGTWIDATGKRTRVVPRFQDGAIVLTVSEDTLNESAFPAVLDPVLSPEFGIDQPVVSVEPADQHSPIVATDGTNFLVVWFDTRSGFTENIATRVSAQGTVLDVGGFKIPTSRCSAHVASFGGGNYVLACPDGMVRVSPEGVVLDTTPIAFPSAPRGGQRVPDLAFNGTNFLLTWTAPGVGPDSAGALFGLVFSPTGTVVMAPKLLSENSVSVLEAAVTAVGGSFRVVYTQAADDMRSMLLDANGELVGTRTRLVSGNMDNQPRYPAVATHGDQYALVYQYGTNYGKDSERISGLIQHADGGTTYYTVTSSKAQEHPDITWVPSQGAYGVVWSNTRNHSTVYTDVVGAWVQPADGGVSAIKTLSSSQTGQFHDTPRIAANETGSMVVWTRKLTQGGRDALGRPLESNTVARELGLSANSQLEPSVAANADGYFLTWRDTRKHVSNLTDLYGARLSKTGEVLDPTGIVIASAVSDEHYPTVSWNGTDWMVAWVEYTTSNGAVVRARRVSSSGQWVDSVPLTLGNTGNKLASSGSLVAWATGSYVGVQARLVQGDGGVVTLGSLPSDAGTHVTVTNTPSQYLVAWEEDGGVRAQRFDTQGAAQGSRIDVAGSGNHPKVASNGVDFLALYSQGTSVPLDIRAVAISSTGQVASTTPLLGKASSEPRTALAWDGTVYTAAWKSFKSSTELPDVVVSRVTRAGGVFDASPFRLFASRPAQEYHRDDFSAVGLASTGDGSFLGVTSYLDASPGISAQRLRARKVVTAEPPRANDATVPTPEDTPISFQLTATDFSGTTPTFSLVTLPPASSGTVQSSGSTAVFTPVADWNGTTTFTFLALTQVGTSLPATITLRVEPVNDPPTMTTPEQLTFDEDDSVQTSSITGVAAGPANESTQTLTLTGTSNNTDVVESVSHGGIANGRAVVRFNLKRNAHGTAEVILTLKDDGTPSLSVSRSIFVTVRPVNDAPVALGQSVTLGLGGGAITLQGTDADGDDLEYRIVQAPANGTLVGTPPHLVFVPTAGFTGETSFTFDVRDGQVASKTATVRITVSSAVPSVRWTGTLEGDEGAPVKFETTVTGEGAGTVAYQWDFGDGTTSTEAQPSHVFADSGEYTVTLTATHATGLNTKQQKRYHIRNLPPVIAPVPRQQVSAGKVLELKLTATDPAGARDPLTWSLRSGPGVVSAAGVYSLDPKDLGTGNHEVKVQVADDDGGKAETPFTVSLEGLRGDDGNEGSQGNGGCGVAGGLGAPGLVLAVLGLARRRRARAL
ncbi:tandem-95 repeat protein [Myxococcus sp. K15C18031901]|uniref:tandem-95 repeat protein n=1 Tax=Myxococcus dinghuensis TaxID=2906761 RepID=UPI0020A781F8|nr:tandem-95 repeat protein [Myxococcus dinghuensis]MCP3099024.1 tandem-95 repeat protein [Myxococcus dinghuensis]